jgi:VWFA-related protein
MTHHSLMIAAMSAIGLTAWATYSSRVVSAQENAGQPVSVYVAALKGECMPERPVAVVNGQVILGPPIYNPPGSDKTILTRFVEDPISRKFAEDEFRKNKMFRVVDSPMQADFVFCLCARYHEFRVPAEMKQSRKKPETVRMGTLAGAVSVESYLKSPRDPKALNEAAFWKTDDHVIDQHDEKTANEKEKNRKEKKDNQVNGPRVFQTNGPFLLMNGRPVEPTPQVLPQDLAKRFIKRWPALAAMISSQPGPQPNSQPGAAGGNEASRPKLLSGVSTETANETKPVVEIRPADPSALRIETTLVIVPVMAMNKDGKYLPGLTVTDFQVYEDNMKQEISDFGSAETPINVALILDVSASTRFKLEDIQDAAMAFVDQLRPQDRVMVVSFDQQVRVEAEFTNERDKLMLAILRTRTGGGTRVQDALDLTLTERLNNIQGRKAIVTFTDGVDNLSRLATWKDVTSQVEESGVIVYPVRYDTLADVTPAFVATGLPRNVKVTVSGANKEEYDRAAQSLKNLAAVSGGRYYEVETIGDTKQAFANIAEELRRYYWLGYYPPNTARDGKYRKISVTVSKPDAVLRARQGYRAPSVESKQ